MLLAGLKEMEKEEKKQTKRKKKNKEKENLTDIQFFTSENQ